MAEKIVSPGVFTREVDQSFLPAGIAAIGAAVVGPTVKGPAGVPKIVSSYSEYQQMFGDKFISGSGASEKSYQYLTSYTAKSYLNAGNTLTVVRILAGSYSGAQSNVASSGTTTTTGDTFASASVTFDAAWVDNQEMRIVDENSATWRFIASGDPIPADDPDGKLYFFSTGSSVTATATNLTIEVNNSALSGSVSASFIAGLFGISGSAAGATYNGITMATSSATAGVGNVVATTAGGTSTTTGTNAGPSFVLHTLADGKLMNSGRTQASTDGSGSTSDETTNNALVQQSGSVDNMRWEISNVNNAKGTFNLGIRRGDDTIKRKTYMEQYNNLTLDPNSPNYIAKVIGDQVMTVRDGGTTSPFLQLSGSYPNKSKYVRVAPVLTTMNYLNSNGTIRTNSLSGSLPAAVSGTFSGGSDGTVQVPANFYENIGLQSQGLLPETAGSGKTSYEDAINILSNQDEFDINLLLMPGIVNSVHSSIVDKAVSMCENRGDCFYIADPTTYNSTLGTATTQAEGYDSNYVAMYYPWMQVYDNLVGNYVWVPPSTLMGGVYAFNDSVAAEWFAPAGLNRGGIDMAVQAERKLTHVNRDTLYEGNINPIATFPNAGVTAWGQKTLQKKASALDRVNVRRLLIAAKKFIASATRYLVFENNTAATRNRFLNIVNPYLESVQQRQGLYAFKVVMDESNNTPDVIDRNEMVGQIFLQPAKTAEFIIIDFNILPTGAAFPE